MNSAEIKQLTDQAQAVGIKTFHDLALFKQKNNCKSNNDLLNAINVAYCTQEMK